MINDATYNDLVELYLGLQDAAAPSTELDKRLYDLIVEPMEVIQGRTLAPGFKYTLNVTNALQLRAKGWYMNIREVGEVNQPFAAASFEHKPSLGVIIGGTNATGHSLGLAATAGIARVWSLIVSDYLNG